MSNLRVRLSLITFAAVLFGQGCASLWNADRSVLEMGSCEQSISLDSVTIKVSPLNGKVFGLFGPLLPIIPIWHSEATSRFWIMISILPTNGEVWFNPKHVALQIEQGATYTAAGYSGPISLSKLGSKLYPVETFLDTKSLNASLSPFPIEAEEVVVGLMFDTKAPDPDERFSLALNGFERLGHPNIDVPLLNFKKERRRYFDFLLLGPLNFRKEWIVESQVREWMRRGRESHFVDLILPV